MLEHVPHWLGHLLAPVRAGGSKIAIVQAGIGRFAALDLLSPAFANGARLPERFTGDGAGVSPPLHWRGVPAAARALALLVEDPDAPAPQPLVHAVVWNLPPTDGSLAEGAIAPDGAGSAAHGDVGLNSYRREGWLPPDPPTGHGVHNYCFQLFALSEPPVLAQTPGRSAVTDALAGRVLAAGLLVGTYSRGEPAASGPVGGLAPA